MFSFHLLKNGKPQQYATGFRSLATSELDDSYPDAYVCRAVRQFVWSPILFREGIRREQNFKAAAVCALDFDAPATTLEWALDTFRDFEHIIGTTKSHRVEKNGIICDRFRVVLFFDGIIQDVETYKHNMKIMVDKYNADKACKDAARFFYPCKEIVSSGNGKFVNIAALPVVANKNETHKKHKPSYFGIKVVPAPAGERDKTVFVTACEMIRRGLDPRWQIDKLRIIANGLTDEEILKCVRNAQRNQK